MVNKNHNCTLKLVEHQEKTCRYIPSLMQSYWSYSFVFQT